MGEVEQQEKELATALICQRLSANATGAHPPQQGKRIWGSSLPLLFNKHKCMLLLAKMCSKHVQSCNYNMY